MTSTVSYYGFIYTIFDFGAKPYGLIAWAWGKACPPRPMGSSLRPNNCDNWP